MTFDVTVRPSGHQFNVETNETLLDAGLRAGLNLRYNCANGSCGGCRVRVLSGTVEPVKTTDFVFTEAQAAAGYVLPCIVRPTSDLVIEAEEAGTAHDIDHQQLQARVSKLEHLQDDLVVLHVRTPRTQTLRFLAGQYVHLELGDGGPGRFLGVASCPCDGMNLRFHLRRAAADPFSEYVFAHVKRGSTVHVRGPYGDFTLDDTSAGPILFVAVETGFAPIASLVEHAIALDIQDPMDFYWLSSRSDGHYLSNYCRSWEDALDRFRFHKLWLQPAGELDRDGAFENILAEYPAIGDYRIFLSLEDQDAIRFVERLVARGAKRRNIRLDCSFFARSSDR